MGSGCCGTQADGSAQTPKKCCVPSGKWACWVGCGISALVVFGLGFSAWMKISQQAPVVEMLTGKFGYPASVITTLGAIEMMIAILYLIRKTSFFGAVLATAYLGGAVATHVRVQDPYIAPVVLGVLVWAGLYLRNPVVAKAVCGGGHCHKNACTPQGDASSSGKSSCCG
jgi:hypothetical protein